VIVDAQIHIWGEDRPDRPWPKAGAGGRTVQPQRASPMSAAEALAEMDAAGVDRAILVPPSWEGDRNDLALAAAAAHPDRFAVMGRLPKGAALTGWRDQPGMLGARIILRNETAIDALWGEAADAGIPMMIAPAGRMKLLALIARRNPALRIIVDHMGARVHQTGARAFADIDHLLALAALQNVAVKATCLPAYSDSLNTWADVTPYLRRLYDAFGADRLFWGSDLSRLPCPYAELISFFRDRLPWLTGSDRDAVMGKAILEWLDWQ